ncbi:YitT family protein [Kytococcus sedentarius]|uniref:membrane protein YczE n=1 Tax=Kytococcus sedentarius TaxID=1276 RepID=UPI0035BC6378
MTTPPTPAADGSPRHSRRPRRPVRRDLAALGPLAQLRAGRLPLRLVWLLVGLALYGASMAMVLRATLGQIPWDVFHVGLGTHLPLTFGVTVVLVSLAVLLLWIPLRQPPGLGTLGNALLIGPAADLTLAVLPTPEDWAPRIGLMVAGIALNGVASAMYIGAQLGPGPRDGLMTGIARRTGLSLRLVRTGLEVTVIVAGVLLGGTLGAATVIYALAIGPLTQAFLPYLTVRLPERAAEPAQGVV